MQQIQAIQEYESKTQRNRPGGQRGEVIVLDQKLFDDLFTKKWQLYILRYRVWPVAFAIEPPLETNNVFVLNEANKVENVFTTSGQLQKFFTDNLKPVKTEESARRALAAWMQLQQELAQDGMFQFAPPSGIAVSKKGDGLVATGKVEVIAKGGDSGTISSTLTFDATGKLMHTADAKALQPGMRPICQAKKLLDEDPIVRRMAKQDILVMGKRCKFYLDLQRKEAAPELQTAIDDLWQRIERENR